MNRKRIRSFAKNVFNRLIKSMGIKKNKHIGSKFNDFLKEEGILKEVTDKAKEELNIKR